MDDGIEEMLENIREGGVWRKEAERLKKIYGNVDKLEYDEALSLLVEDIYCTVRNPVLRAFVLSMLLG